MYYAININEYRQDDIPSLKRLWMETFGDAPELVDRFFELLPSMGKPGLSQRQTVSFWALRIFWTPSFGAQKSRR